MTESVRYKDLQLATLRSFCEVALSGNFTEAGKQLRLSTPTIWQQVRALERKLQVRLFRRQGRAVVLTVEGKLLFELVRDHVSGLDSLARRFEAERSDLPQQLTIASTPYFMSYHLPQPTQHFNTENPSVHMTFSVLDTSEILQVVKRGEADIGITSLIPDDSQIPTLSYEPLFEIPFTLLTSSEHPLARKKALNPSDLVKYPLIMPPAHGYDARLLQQILLRHNMTDQIRPVMETRNLEIIARYVALNIGIAVCHVSLDIKELLPGLHLRVFNSNLPKLVAAVVVRKGAHLPPAVEEFRTILRQSWGRMNSSGDS